MKYYVRSDIIQDDEQSRYSYYESYGTWYLYDSQHPNKVLKSFDTESNLLDYVNSLKKIDTKYSNEEYEEEMQEDKKFKYYLPKNVYYKFNGQSFHTSKEYETLAFNKEKAISNIKFQINKDHGHRYLAKIEFDADKIKIR